MTPPEDPSTLVLSGIVENIGKIFSGAMDMAATVGSTIVGNPLLLFGVVVGFVGLGVGLFKRLLNV